jgi:hypothetical protein
MSVATLKRYLAQRAYVKMAQWWLEEDLGYESLSPRDLHELHFGQPAAAEARADFLLDPVR